MTLVATLGIERVPILFGDLLWTGPQPFQQGGATHIPTQGDVSDFFGSSDWFISGLRQKVNIISPHCVLACAGDWLGARMAIQGLRNIAASEPITFSTLEEFLENNPDPEIRRSCLVGFLYEDGNIHRISHNGRESQFNFLGTVAHEGSGSHVLNQLDQYLAEEFRPLTPGTVGPLASAISKTCLLGAFLLYSEFSGGDKADTLLSMFGGGYEIAYFDNGQFRKLPEITFTFREARIYDERTTVSEPLLVLKQSYINDYLAIRSIQFEHKNNTEAHVSRDETFIVQPMFAVEHKPSIKESISLNSRCHCHFISVVRNNVAIDIFSTFTSFGNTEPSVNFIEKKGKIRVATHRETLMMLAHGANRFRMDT